MLAHPTLRIGGRELRNIYISALPILSQLNNAGSSTPEGLGATHFRACTHAAVLRTGRTCRTGLPARQTTPAIVFAVRGDVAFTGNKSARLAG